ncbi:hypothetical protein MKX03_001018 [Papaver bracteatum]|nr:hypothetical protein MKX03_001018 [Papaver bracteatum]
MRLLAKLGIPHFDRLPSFWLDKAKIYSCNNQMGLRAGANPSFTWKGTKAIINYINGFQCSVN